MPATSFGGFLSDNDLKYFLLIGGVFSLVVAAEMLDGLRFRLLLVVASLVLVNRLCIQAERASEEEEGAEATKSKKIASTRNFRILAYFRLF